jgi:hypothetical protein
MFFYEQGENKENKRTGVVTTMKGEFQSSFGVVED